MCGQPLWPFRAASPGVRGVSKPARAQRANISPSPSSQHRTYAKNAFTYPDEAAESLTPGCVSSRPRVRCAESRTPLSENTEEIYYTSSTIPTP